MGPSTNTDPPLRNYYAEVSYGTEELDGRVFGPFQYSLGDCNTERHADHVPRDGRFDGRRNLQPLPLVHGIANLGV